MLFNTCSIRLPSTGIVQTVEMVEMVELVVVMELLLLGKVVDVPKPAANASTIAKATMTATVLLFISARIVVWVSLIMLVVLYLSRMI